MSHTVKINLNKINSQLSRDIITDGRLLWLVRMKIKDRDVPNQATGQREVFFVMLPLLLNKHTHYQGHLLFQNRPTRLNNRITFFITSMLFLLYLLQIYYGHILLQ